MAKEKVEAVNIVEAEEPKTVVVQEKYVKVTPKITGKRFVSGAWLDLVKDKEIEVTQDQKRVLREADAIYI